MTGNIIKLLLSPSAFNGPGGTHMEGSLLFVIIIVSALVGVFAASLIWLQKDAQRRNKNAFVAILFILLTGWPGSFLWWFWLRPPLKGEK
jgi:uncharacterized membrane protein